MRKLYELSEDYQRILEIIEDDEFTPTEDEFKAMLKVEDDFHSKAQNVGKLIASINVDIEAFKAKQERAAVQEKSATNKRDYLKGYALWCLQQAGVKKVEGEVTVRRQNAAPSCGVVDENLIPESFMVFPEPPPPRVDKRAVLDHFKETGEIVPGVEIVTDREFVVVK